MPTYISAMLKILDDNNVSYNDDIIKIITPLGVKGTAKHFIELGVNKPLDEIVSNMKEYMFEKYLNDIPAKKGAKETGMIVCGVYDISSDEYTEQIKSATDLYIYDFNELLDLPVLKN